MDWINRKKPKKGEKMGVSISSGLEAVNEYIVSELEKKSNLIFEQGTNFILANEFDIKNPSIANARNYDKFLEICNWMLDPIPRLDADNLDMRRRSISMTRYNSYREVLKIVTDGLADIGNMGRKKLMEYMINQFCKEKDTLRNFSVGEIKILEDILIDVRVEAFDHRNRYGDTPSFSENHELKKFAKEQMSPMFPKYSGR